MKEHQINFAVILILVAAVGLLGGCAGRPVVETGFKDLPIAVSVPCVSGQRPEKLAPLRMKIPASAWAGLTTKQKLAHIGDQALGHQSRADGIDAATAGCR